jgi:predicted DsbA family dithiol-disulfide isomerase
LIHLAKESGKQDAMKERLLKAYFSEGKNVDDRETLISLGQEIGIDPEMTKQIFDEKLYENAVDQDIYESRLDRKFGISGAQPDEVFDQTLEKAWAAYVKDNPVISLESSNDAPSCEVDGTCL